MDIKEFQENFSQKELIKKYKEIVSNILPLNFPSLTNRELQEAIDYSISKRLYNGTAEIYNNYKEKTININMIDLAEYIMKKEPIMTAYGVMFKKHDEAPNPIIDVITKFLNGRKAYKKEMFKYPKGSEQFEKYNLLQLLAKIDTKQPLASLNLLNCWKFLRA